MGPRPTARQLLDERKPGEAVIPAAEYTAQGYDAPTLAATRMTLRGLQRAQSAATLHAG